MKTQIIANWQPSELDDIVIREELWKLLKDLNFSYLAIEVTHDPYDRLTPDTKEFHHDSNGRDMNLIVWSNQYPTEIRYPDGSILPTQDGDLILIHNTEVTHRVPEYLGKRWFTRVLYVRK